VTVVFLPPQKFVRPPCCYYWLQEIKKIRGCDIFQWLKFHINFSESQEDGWIFLRNVGIQQEVSLHGAITQTTTPLTYATVRTFKTYSYMRSFYARRAKHGFNFYSSWFLCLSLLNCPYFNNLLRYRIVLQQKTSSRFMNTVVSYIIALLGMGILNTYKSLKVIWAKISDCFLLNMNAFSNGKCVSTLATVSWQGYFNKSVT
jgi:hypothetical protein